MRTPLRQISESDAVKLVATGAYFTRLYNDLVTGRRRFCQDYYWEIIQRAMIGTTDPSSRHSVQLLREAGERVDVFNAAYSRGRLLHGSSTPPSFVQGGSASGGGRR
jgi:hypothetical protein